jgi:hypothetical protein
MYAYLVLLSMIHVLNVTSVTTLGEVSKPLNSLFVRSLITDLLGARFEIFAAVKIQVEVFWVVTP